MRNQVVCMAPVALLAGACSAPTETTNVVGVPPLALARSGRPIAPRAIKPAKTPITVVQAQTPERKLTRDERHQIRESLRGQQAPVRSGLFPFPAFGP